MTRKDTFIADIRRAVAMMHPPIVEADSDQADVDALQGIIHRGDLWLTATFVESFDQSDWSGLPQGIATALASAVEKFRSIAVSVPSNGPATPEQSSQARSLLLDIDCIITARACG